MSAFGKAANLEFISKQAKSLFASEVYKESNVNEATNARKKQSGVFEALDKPPLSTAMQGVLFLLMPGKKAQLALQVARTLFDGVNDKTSLSDATKAMRQTQQQQDSHTPASGDKSNLLVETFNALKRNLESNSAQKSRRSHSPG